MPRLVLMPIALLISLNAFSQSTIGPFKVEATRKGHTTTVSFAFGKFNSKEHKISGFDPCTNFMTVKIDGRTPLGTGICSTPEYEIQSMSLEFDGRRIEIPKNLFSDCYEPPFARSTSHTSDYFWAKIGDDLKSVFIFMSGGDGAGSYSLIWVLRSDGKHSRISSTASDCGFINFDCPIEQR